MLIGDKHKTNWPKGLFFNLLASLAYDLEPIAPAAGQSRNAKAACPGTTSIRQCLFPAALLPAPIRIHAFFAFSGIFKAEINSASAFKTFQAGSFLL
ncbi:MULTISPECIES: hypothetical protein [Bacillus]|uniref:hypothetical protein n=1 Tax=Bacillus TaxID=1386 RepID=UPI00101D07AD|nr:MULTISPECIES: hypothetical protein [Bacillus]MDT0163909.1 hypothetical protein [Bacillus sp. AG4(2022)]RYI25017.1 hypothetical protein EVU96_25185 [Bacillus infantis]